MKIKILTLFPKMFEGFLGESIIKRAIDKKVVSFEIIDIRDYSLDKHHHVDDTPYGGGAGMIMQVDVLHRAIMANKSDNTHIMLTSPQGSTYNEAKALELSKLDEIMIICGHYEGVDERIIKYCDECISIGDYVLTGGEIPALVISDSITRLIDGTITSESKDDDTFSTGLLEYPQFTRPYEFLGDKVPDVLINGNHKLIALYRHNESLRKTYKYRKDLLDNYELTLEDKKFLDSLKDINNE